MLNPSPERADVRVRILHEGATFTTLARVIFVLPNMGMGVVFKSIADDQLAILQEWIARLSRGE